jgi:hypothetical protein
MYIKTLLFFCFTLSITTCHAAFTLDGSSAIVYEQTPYAFSDGTSAGGFVWFSAGFSVSSGTAILNILPAVSGQINLNNSGTILLSGDLTLASDVTLADGGNIDGNGFSIFLQGNLTIPAGAVLGIKSNTVIDAQGHEIIFGGAHAGVMSGFMVDAAAPANLTIRNARLRGVKSVDTTQNPFMFGTSPNQKITLENVTMYMDKDVTFDGGELNIVGNTIISGEHTFNYNAPYDLTIQKNSSLLLDIRSTLAYAPSDSSPEHLKFKASNSRLILHGGTLYAPKEIGLRLYNGQLIVDHASQLSQNWTAADNFGDQAQAIWIGDGQNPKFNLAIDILPAAQLEEVAASVVYQNRQ